MHASSNTGSPNKALILTAGLLVITGTAAAMASQPIMGPPIAIGETGAAVADPLVPVPAETPCVVTLYTASSTTGTFDDYANHPFSYTPPAACHGPWNKVVFKADYHVTTGRQFDRTASVWIGGTNIYFGTTQEPSAARAPSWHVERDVTNLASLLMSPQPGNTALYNIYNSTYNGSITGGAELDFYPATPEFPAPRVPDQVLSLSSDPAGVYANINTDGAPLSRTFTLPTNIDRAYLDVIAQPQSGDEFWYSCGPDTYIDLTGCGGTAFREAEVSIDGKPAGIVPISGWVFTGGVDPYLWRPIPGVQTLDFEPYQVNITPFAGLLDNGQPHTISVSVVTGDPTFKNNSQYFATAATLVLYQDRAATQLTGALTQDSDSGIHPVQSNTANPDGVHFALAVTSRHSLVTRGYLDTPHGRVPSNVVQDVRFGNSQLIVASNSQFEQDIQQTSSSSQRSYGRPYDGSPANTTTNWSFPLDMDINLLVASDGSETQATTVNQNYSRQYSEGGPGGHFASSRSQSDNAADTLNFDANGAFTGPTGQQASQGYTFTDSRGACYSRSVSAVAGAVTQVTDGSACQAHVRGH
ncbi:MAG: peptide-N(4)-(N-acetyl-beta-glucosaminyl)asparagine amidase [Xanthomonadaceae bacterium]|nr:peptide-N(4)-(N-acetyl-beta-glucosaminyl)asparagine amidase [Xanthomonadaceae bacterium]